MPDQFRRADHLAIPVVDRLVIAARAIRSLPGLKKYWLLFTQGVTVLLAALFVLATLRPEWLPRPLRQPPSHAEDVARSATVGSAPTDQPGVGRGGAAGPVPAAPGGQVTGASVG